jgi:superkiller protein 3
MCRRRVSSSILILLSLVAVASCSRGDGYEMLAEAYSLEQDEKSEIALERFAEAASVFPDPYLKSELAAAYVRRRRFDDAVALLEEVLDEEPTFVDGSRHLAAAYAGMHDVPAAIQVLENLSAAAPGLPRVEGDLIHLYMTEDLLDLAAERLLGVTQQHPEERWAHLQLGHLYFQLRAFDQALDSYRALLELNPNDAYAYAALGNTHYEMREIDASIATYQKAIDLNPRDHRSMNNLAWVFAMESIRVQDGVRLSRRSLRLRPGSPTYLDTLAELHFKQGDATRALGLIERALKVADEENASLVEHLKRQQARFLAAGQGRV